MRLDPDHRRRSRRYRNRLDAPLARPLVPLLLLFSAVLIYAGGGGCSLAGGAIASPFLSDQQRAALAGQQVQAAVTALSQGETATADALLSRAVALLSGLRIDGYILDGYSEVGEELVRGGRPEALKAAVRLLEPATQRPELASNPGLWAILAEAAARTGDENRARRARSEAQKHSDALLNAIGRDQVPKVMSEAVQAANKYRRLGDYFLRFQNDAPTAISAYREALRLKPDDPALQNSLGYTLADRGTTPDEFEKAIELTRKAVEGAPNQPMYLDSYGWALLKRGDTAQKDTEGARRVLREAVDAAPYHPEIRYHLGVTYAELGLYREASQELSRVLMLDPQNKAAKAAMQLLPSPYNTADTTNTTPVVDAVASPSPAASPIPSASASPSSAPSLASPSPAPSAMASPLVTQP